VVLLDVLRAGRGRPATVLGVRGECTADSPRWCIWKTSQSINRVSD